MLVPLCLDQFQWLALHITAALPWKEKDAFLKTVISLRQWRSILSISGVEQPYVAFLRRRYESFKYSRRLKYLFARS